MVDHIANIISTLAALGKKKSIVVQVPGGLKTRAVELLEALGKNGFSVVLAADDCFGACDLPLQAAAASGADAILHIGHVPFYKSVESKIPVVYYEWPIEVSLDEKKLQNEIAKIKEKKIGIISSVQYLHLLDKIAETIRAAGKDVIVGGHVLGCWTKNADDLAKKTDALMFVGSGMFHPRGFSCDYFFDLERGIVSDVRNEINRFEKIRWARISKAKDARTFGILVSTKPGQADIEQANEVRAELAKRDKKAFILVMDKITEQSLLGFAVDAFINTACPRLADDEWTKPFVNATDVDKLFDEA